MKPVPPSLVPYADAIGKVCRRWNVRRLELFGSALRSDFDARDSDYDFLVLYHEPRRLPSDRAWSTLEQELSEAVRRPVDVIDVREARNPYLLVEALKDRSIVYDEPRE